MRRYELIIFDLDGTIADTSPGIINCVRYVQEQMHLPQITLREMYYHVGPPMEESYNRNFHLSGDALKKAVELHKEYALRQGYRELEIYEGIPDLLCLLRKCGYKLAVATLKAQSTVNKIFEEFRLSSKFDYVIGTDSKNPMSKSELLETCMRELKSTKAVLVGDSKYDALGAKEAGIDFVAVTYGFGFSDKKIDFPSVNICNSVKDIAMCFV